MKVALVLVSLALCVTVAKKDTARSASKRPKSVSSELYCVACQGIVRETLRRLHHKAQESDVIAAMEDLCDMWKYKTYDYPPPEMKRGCNALLGEFEEDLEWALSNRHKLDEDVETYFCHRKTKACGDLDQPETNLDDLIKEAEAKGPIKKAKIVKENHAHDHHSEV